MRTATIYNFLIEANIIAGLAILLMIPIRKFFRKQLGNRALCFAWLLVAIRLLCPLALPNPLMNEIVTPFNYDQEAIRPIAGQVRVRVQDALNEAAQSTANSAKEKGMTFAEAIRTEDYRRLQGMADSIYNGSAAKTVMALYLCGMGAVTLWMAVTNIRFRMKLKKNRFEPLSGETLERYRALCARYGVKPVPVYWTDPLSGACLVGVMKPFIALPLAAGEEQALQMLRHEICHIKAKDQLWTLLTLLCCVIHWFNPLVWMAAAMSRMERELRCDDLVTRDMDDEEKRLYAGTLIQAVTRRTMPGMPVLATGMSMTGRKLKTRVGSILAGDRRRKALAVLFALAATALLVLAFGTAATRPAALADNGQETQTEDVRGAMDEAYLAGVPAAQEGEYGPDHLMTNEEQAVAYAKMLWTGPLLQGDLTGATCSVFRLNTEEDGAYDAYVKLPDGRTIGVTGRTAPDSYGVQFWLKNGNVLGASFHSDGSVEYLFNGDMDHYAGEDAKVQGTPEEREELKRQILEIAERLEPGITEKITRVDDLGDEMLRDIRFACFSLEVPGEDSRSVCVTLPDLIVVEYGTGNG
ncbi:MAG: M56 family metallopeptidase [Clostridia bacterium]|nr:M56 family metallopeptidase [Clostridia bacterium]